MPSIQRPLSADVLTFDLEDELAQVTDAALLQRSGRIARTLIKSGALRVTLVVLAPGGEIPEHRADGPIMVQPVRGRIRFRAAGRDHQLEPGRILSAGAAVPHSVSSDEGGAFLLTVTSRAQRED